MATASFLSIARGVLRPGAAQSCHCNPSAYLQCGTHLLLLVSACLVSVREHTCKLIRSDHDQMIVLGRSAKCACMQGRCRF